MPAATAKKSSATSRSRRPRSSGKPAEPKTVPTVLQDRFEVELFGTVVQDLVTIVKVVALAASKDDAREILTGVLIESDGAGTVKFRATDAYRLHVVTWKPPADDPWPKLRAIVPAAWLARVLPNRRIHPAYRFELTVADGRITWFDDASGERFSKTLIGEADVKFPATDKIIPALDATDTDQVRAFNPKQLADIFKAAHIFGDGGYRGAAGPPARPDDPVPVHRPERRAERNRRPADGPDARSDRLMAAEYKPAPEVAEIARQLITRVTQHQELVNATILYLFRSEAATSRGRTILGRARKVTGLNAWLSHPDLIPRPGCFTEPGEFFIIEIAHDTWARLDDSQRVALVDHELSHCAVGYTEDGRMQLAMRHHDVEEFLGVLNRNGLWKEDVQQLGIVASEQLSLALDRIPAQASEGGDS